jgi:hypothetical protein
MNLVLLDIDGPLKHRPVSPSVPESAFGRLILLPLIGQPSCCIRRYFVDAATIQGSSRLPNATVASKEGRLSLSA